MQKYLLIALAMPFALLSRAEAKNITTAGDLFASCTSTIELESTVCAVYMAGFMNGVTFEQITRGDGHQKICLPAGMTGKRVKTVFEGFMRDFPKLQQGENNPAAVIGIALFKAYPCPGSIK